MRKKRTTIIISVIAILLAIVAIPIFTSCTPREEILKVYNWQEYIGEDVLDGFEEYYKEITGKNIKVRYTNFDTNELMMSKVFTRSDYDVVCPSDYAIEKMRNNDQLLKLEKNLGVDVNGNEIEDYRNMVSDLVLNREFDPTNEYSRAYTWGTMGILYNEDRILNNSKVPAHLKVDNDGDGHIDYFNEMGWGALWDTRFKNDIYMKDSVRDSYAIASIYTFKDKILAGEMTPDDALNATTPAQIAMIEKSLKEQFPIIRGYEVDNGKQEAVDGSISMTLQWGGDAVWAIADANELNDKDKNPNNDVHLKYFIPAEGSNIFFDGWCIPKYARNESAAQLFINYMCRPDVSMANMDYIGYSSPCNTEEFVEYMAEAFPEEEARAIEYFMGNDTLVHAPEIMYPKPEVIARCGVMRDFGSADMLINNMWINVKST